MNYIANETCLQDIFCWDDDGKFTFLMGKFVLFGHDEESVYATFQYILVVGLKYESEISDAALRCFTKLSITFD